MAPLERRRRASAAASGRRGCRCAAAGSGRRAAPRSRPGRAPRGGRPRARARAAARRGESRCGRRRPRCPRRARTPAPPPPPARRTAARPRSGAARPGASVVLGIGDAERRDAEHDLARHAQRLAARREDRQPRRGAQQRVREVAVAPSSARSCPATSSSDAARGTRRPRRRRPVPAARARRAPPRPRPGRARHR